jgi:hypothetical protein
MLGQSSKSRRKYFESMIELRERLQVPYTESIGFEGSDQALLLAQVTVYKAILKLDTPGWAVKGDKKFRKHLKKTNQKLPDYDFHILEEFTPRFWDSFRFILLRPDNSGSFKHIVVEELRSEFIKIFKAFLTSAIFDIPVERIIFLFGFPTCLRYGRFVISPLGILNISNPKSFKSFILS